MPLDIGGIATLSSPAGTTLSLDGASNWMTVNANGILSRSQTPYMRGQISGRGTPYNAGGGPLLITAAVNVGNCWNDATGRFTCPVSGYYMTTMGNIAGQQAGYLNIRRNGGDVHFAHWNHMCSWHYISLSCPIAANPGDYLSWHVTGLTPATNGLYGDGGHCMYSIALMM